MTIVVEHLSRSFGPIEAVKSIDFTVERGETFGFLGPNGAGKSTTIKMLCTLLRPSSGRAVVNGYDVERESAAVRQSIGIVFQEPTLDEYLTAEQNLRYHCMIYHTSRVSREGRIREVLQLVGLDDRRKDLVKTFSGGMKRRLEVARACSTSRKPSSLMSRPWALTHRHAVASGNTSYACVKALA